MDAYVLALGGVIGSAVKAWVTVSQPTWSKQSAVDVVLGGVVGLLWTLWPPFDLPATASLVQKAAIVGVTAYFSSDLISNLAKRFGVGPVTPASAVKPARPQAP